MKKFIVISHTHWDREWYMSFAVFRLKLADLVDRLFLILERDPEYIFHLDMQTIVLEDYLEIRPENENLLKKYVASGNIRVGPWYLQNDFYLTDGESTVRNLMFGTALAESFGKCGKVGYAPDQFGNVSQLPQILNGFGVRSFIFGRGFREYETADGARREKFLPAEFEWRGEDGSRCIAVYLRHWYNNAQHIPADKELAKLLLTINEKNFEGFNLSPYILLMNGVDHLEAQGDVRDIISSLRADGVDIRQSSLDDYAEKLLDFLDGKTLPSYTGALNKGGDYEILKGCWSSRIYLKRSNVRAEDLLENKLEPLYTYLLTSSFENVYPAGEMRYLWKSLLKNHPHDSICGCSVDSVHRHMEDSFQRIDEMGEELLSRGLKLVALHSGHPLAAAENYSVTVFNPTERMCGGVAEAELCFLASENIVDFSIRDGEGKEIPYEIVERKTGTLDVFSPLNLPGVLDVNRVRVRFFAQDVPAFAAKIYAVLPHAKGATLVSALADSGIENEFYRVWVCGGALQILNKRTGESYLHPLRLEDTADRGDAYVYRRAAEAPIVVLPDRFSAPFGGALKQSLTAYFAYDCPARYDFEAGRRSAETVRMKAEITLTLAAGSEGIEMAYRLRNCACDHRVRLIVGGGITGGKLFTDSPFDYAERLSHESCDVTDADTHHNSTFAELRLADKAFAVYTEGQHETEPVSDGLAFTVLRATGVISRHSQTFVPTGGKCWEVPENQCLREIEGRLFAEYGVAESAAKRFAKGKFFRVGFLCAGDSFDAKKYSGGRFAVQAAELEKLYYLPDTYADCAVSGESFFRLDADEIAVTCCKAAEKGGAAVRFVNLSSDPVTVALSFRGKAYVATLSERSETFAGERETTLSFRPKQIITMRFSDV